MSALTDYMKRDLHFAGYKAFNAGVQSSGYSTQEWDDLWKEGWESAKHEAELLANSETGSIW